MGFPTECCVVALPLGLTSLSAVFRGVIPSPGSHADGDWGAAGQHSLLLHPQQEAVRISYFRGDSVIATYFFVPLGYMSW